MKPHPRIRKTVKWGGAAVSVVLMVAWVGSKWYEAGYMTSGGNSVLLAAGPGTVAVRWPLLLGLYDLVFALTAYAVFDFLLED